MEMNPKNPEKTQFPPILKIFIFLPVNLRKKFAPFLSNLFRVIHIAI